MFNKLTLGIVMGLMTSSAVAQTNIHANSDSSAYAQDARGIIVRSGFGLCWRTGYWISTDAVPGCDGELLPPIVKHTAPAIVLPTTGPIKEIPIIAPIAPIPPKRCDFSINLENDQAFAFDKATLNEQAKVRLDKDLFAKLAGCSKIEVLRISGHTDRLGSQQYNQQLSEKRAESVVAHLKAKGISTPIDAIGMGKSQAIVECNDKSSAKKLITCLAPNRRVEIQVLGIAK